MRRKNGRGRREILRRQGGGGARRVRRDKEEEDEDGEKYGVDVLQLGNEEYK